MDIDLIGPEELSDQEIRARFSAKITDKLLRTLEVKYKKNNNPLYHWFAIQICTDFQAPLPEWVADYLRDSAKEITGYGKTKSKSQRGSEIVYKALRMNKGKGPGDCFSDFQRDIEEVEILLEIHEKLQKSGGKNIVKILESIAKKRNVSFEKMRAIHYSSCENEAIN